MKTIVFHNQSNILKLLYIILYLYCVFTKNFTELALFIIVNILLYIPALIIIKSFFQSFLNLAYFWIFYLLSGLIVKIDFNVQLNFLLTVCSLIIITSFIRHSFRFEDVFHPKNYLMRFKFYQGLGYFLISFNVALTTIQETFKRDDIKINKSFMESIVQIFKATFERLNVRDLPDLDCITDEPNQKRVFPNLYLVLMIIIIAIPFGKIW